MVLRGAWCRDDILATQFCQASCRLADSCHACVLRAVQSDYRLPHYALHALAVGSVSQAISTISHALAGLVTGWPGWRQLDTRLTLTTVDSTQQTPAGWLVGWLAVSAACLQPAYGSDNWQYGS